MEKSEKIWMDGKLVPWNEANIHVLTHTLHYGLGVFEGIRCYNSKDKKSVIFRLQEHVDRLFQSAVILGIEVPFSKKEISNAIIQVVRENNLEECYIRQIIFLVTKAKQINAHKCRFATDLVTSRRLQFFLCRTCSLGGGKVFNSLMTQDSRKGKEEKGKTSQIRMP